MIPFLSFFLNWLGGGVLTKVLDHLEAKAKLENDRERLKTEVTISEIKAELATRQEQAAIVRAQMETPIQWVPRFLIELSTAVYIMAIVIDKIWDLPGEVSDLPPSVGWLLSTVCGGMFLTKAIRKAQ